MRDELPEPGITAERTFRVGDEHATTLFGHQDEPPGAPAAVDADPDEYVDVLGTPQLLAAAEFLSRESLNGRLPDGAGLVGIRADVTHRSAVPIGRVVRVRTELTDVAGRKLTFEGTISGLDSEELVGEVTVCLQVVERASFTERLDR